MWYLPTVEYYSALKRKEIPLICYKMGELLRLYTKRNKPVYDSTYTRYPESTSERQKVECQLPEAGRREEVGSYLTGAEFQFSKVKES
jgi:hypothetical protein